MKNIEKYNYFFILLMCNINRLNVRNEIELYLMFNLIFCIMINILHNWTLTQMRSNNSQQWNQGVMRKGTQPKISFIYFTNISQPLDFSFRIGFVREVQKTKWEVWYFSFLHGHTLNFGLLTVYLGWFRHIYVKLTREH